MRAIDTEIVAIDFETTGTVEGWQAEPWQIGMVRLREGRVDPESMYTSLLRIGDRPFNPHAPGKHHQLRKELAEAPTLHELWPELQSWWISCPLVAHNTATEKKIMRQAAPMHSVGPWLDTLKLIRLAYPKHASHKLEDLVEELEVVARMEALCPGLAPHDALYDAVASAVLLEHVLTLPGWEDASIDALAQAHPERYYASRGLKRFGP